MIYLFGDSFVENETAESLGVPDHERWYQMLSNNLGEEHKNYGKCGEGSSASLARFHRLYENQEFKSNDKFVFVLSSPYRIPWTWLPDECWASRVYEDWQIKRDASWTKQDASCAKAVRHGKCVNELYESMWD